MSVTLKIKHSKKVIINIFNDNYYSEYCIIHRCILNINNSFTSITFYLYFPFLVN